MNPASDHATTESTGAPAGTLELLLKEMRIKEWVKNIFVFAGVVFAGGQLLTQWSALLKVGVGFVLFCLVSSSVYIFNDLKDLEQDRRHPRKRLRPLASGRLSPRLATAVALALPLVSFGLCAGMALKTDPLDMGWVWFGVVLLTYLVLQMAYTFKLKQIVLLDVFAISGGFILRAVAGAAILLVNITPWWLFSLFFLTLFLGLGKRRHELQTLEQNAGSHRRTLEEYSLQFLDYMLMIDIACTIVVYSLATFTAPLVAHMTYPLLMLTVPFVVLALFRYLYLIVVRGEGGDIADLLFRDTYLLATIVVWGLLVVGIQLWRF